MKMNKENGKYFIGMIGMLIILAFGYCLIPGKVVEASQEHREVTYKGEGYTVILTVNEQWDTAFSASVVIQNTGNEVIENWSLNYELPYVMTNIWNAEVASYEEGEYTIKNAEYNQDIEPQDKVHFGFTAKGEGKLILPDVFTMKKKSQTVLTDGVKIYFDITNKWESGFNGEIIVENNTGQVIEDWSLEFDCSYNIIDFWTADIVSRENEHYRIKNKGWNANIVPGEKLVLGFRGEGYSVDGYFQNARLSQIKTVEQGETISEEIGLAVFSEYGANFLEWELTNGCIFEVLRKSEGGDFIALAEITGANYFVDAEVDSGKKYEYKLVKRNVFTNEVAYSDSVSILATEQVTDIPEEPVKEVLDLMILESDYEELQIEYGNNDWEGHVSKNVGLRLKGKYGSDITWSSNDKKLISNEGVVTRCMDSDCVVVLIATIHSGNYVSEKEFCLNVIRADQVITEVQEVSWEDIEEINGGELPEIQFDNNGDIKRICGKYTKMLVYTENDARASLKGLQELLGVKDVYNELILDRESKDEYGKVFSFDQCYNGLPILGSDIVIHVADNGETEYLSSSFIKNLYVDTEVLVSEDELKEIVRERYQTTDISIRLFLFRENVEEDTVTLCYEVIAEGNTNTSYRLFIDAKNAEVIYSEPMEKGIKVTSSTAKDMYGEEKKVPVVKRGILFWKKYYLEDINRNIHICDGTGVSSDSNYTTMTNTENIWNDETAITAYDHIIQVYDYFDSAFSWKGYDGKNGSMKVVVHYQENKELPYFELDNIDDLLEIYYKYSISLPDGLTDVQINFINGIMPPTPSETWKSMELDIIKKLISGIEGYVEEGHNVLPVLKMVDVSNAYSGGGTLKFGDGDGKVTKSYASALDIVAHEFTHSVTRVKLNLLYSNQAGAIDEAYSDIFGELIEGDERWLHAVDHHIGELQGKPGRNIGCPEESCNMKYPSAAYMTHYRTICPDGNHESHNNCDNGYVHRNSTVISHAAYLMAQKGLTVDEMKEMWFKSYDFYYNDSTPDFMDCREAVILAAKQIGLSDEKVKYVREAFDEVNITSNDITITFIEASTNKVLPQYVVELVSVDKTHCKLTGECCELENRGLSCDPEMCWHKCGEECSIPCEVAEQRCCGESVRISSIGKTNSNGEVKFYNIMSGYHRVYFKSLIHHSEGELIYVDNDSNNFVFLIESQYNNSIKGCVLKSDENNADFNNEVMGWTKVILTKKTGNKELNMIEYTDSKGEYCFDNIPSGEYEIVVEKIGYMTKIETVFVEKNQVLCCDFYINDIRKGMGYASGTVFDSFSGQGVSNLTLYFQKGENMKIPAGANDDSVIGMAETGENGIYISPELEEGYYTVVICDNREGIREEERYSTSFFLLKIKKNQEVKNQNGTVLVNPKKQPIHVVLEWGASTKDLDLRASVGTLGKSTTSGKNAGTLYFENLDNREIEYGIKHNDSQNGLDAERVTLFIDNVEGMYSLSVSNYTDWMIDYDFKKSGAKVSVYWGDSDVPCKVYYPSEGKGVYWYVFSYDSKIESFFDKNYLYSIEDMREEMGSQE